MPTGAIVGIVIAVVFLFVLLILCATCVRIVRQTENVIVERLGKYYKTWSTGIHFLAPFVDHVVKKVSLKEQIYDFPPQPVITKDNVTMQIDSIVFFRVMDPKLYAYGVEDPIAGIQALTATTMRNLIGDIDLDDTLTSRDYINNKMRTIVDEATDPWGIKVTRVEVKNILPPRDIQEAMEKQMRAEREKREKILIAEGEKTSAITIAEGRKEAAILNAEAEKQSAIAKAEGEAQSILNIKKAQADGEIMVRTAEAQGIKLLNEAKPNEQAMAIRALEALEKLANGTATKIVVPSNLQDLSSYLTVTKAVLLDDKAVTKAAVTPNAVPAPEATPAPVMSATTPAKK
ncbi:MAG: SPFH/Band 7/PHB domain protein [Bacilli bacterium]|jgi:regulator of protease activity HflC (stomatin/prohibitin superfamily)|nr:SPFH/Band 7/PHB domain protein [Bacilli bacterium]